MQTFLPDPNFAESARLLDRRRLGKQRIETLQLLRALTGETTGWRNHPAAKMWAGCENALVLYGLAMCDEWIKRGYNDTTRARIKAFYNPRKATTFPTWLGDIWFHRSHQSNLVRKDPAFYAHLFPGVPADMPYMWPHHEPRTLTDEGTPLVPVLFNEEPHHARRRRTSTLRVM